MRPRKTEKNFIKKPETLASFTPALIPLKISPGPLSVL
jgi:hypothetical protein